MADYTILVVGDSGAGKTSLIDSIASYVKSTTGKVTRLISGDGGKWDSIEHAVQAGAIEPWDISQHINPFETLLYASQGYWPQSTSDPASPLVAPDAKLWERVGAYAFEGLTGFGNIFLNALSDRGAKGEKIGENAPAAFLDGKTRFAGANPTYYGLAQRRVMDAVERSRSLPIVINYWSALQMRATDKDQNVPIFGPELVGSAKTGDIPRWFGNCLGIVQWPLQGGKSERRLYLSTYFDEKNPHVPHLCKSGSIPAIVAGDVPQFLPLIPAHDKPWGIGAYVELAKKKQAEAVKLYGSWSKA